MAVGEDRERTNSSGLVASSPRLRPGPAKPLGQLALVILIFYEVSGGPFGVEDAVESGGPLLTILGFLIFPLFWSLPEALLTAELATTFPENSGYVAWVTEAFGPTWGFMEGYLSWLSGVMDNAIYPIYFAQTLSYYVAPLKRKAYQVVFAASVSGVLTYVNYRGLEIVGRVSEGLTLFVLAPFLALVVAGLPRVRLAPLVQVDLANVDWRAYLNVMFWNLNYWDSASTLAGEVRDPKRTFPRALAGALALVVAAYLLPVVVGLGSGATSAAAWDNGYFVVVAQRLVGEWLGVWVVLSAAASNLGQFMAEMSSDSYQLHGMAERGMVPSIFAHKSRHGTPTNGILASSIGLLFVFWVDFGKLIESLNLAYAFAALLEFAAFIALRVRRPNLHRPFRVPLSTGGCIAMLVAPTALILLVVLLPLLDMDWRAVGFEVGVVALGYPLWRLLRWLDRHQAVNFAALVEGKAYDSKTVEMLHVLDEGDSSSGGTSERNLLVGRDSLGDSSHEK